MRAYRLEAIGTASLCDIPRPAPSPGQVLVKIMACGLNFADLLMITGKYQERPTPPFTLGMELAGVVEACGADVDGLPVGTRVAVFSGTGGMGLF